MVRHRPSSGLVLVLTLLQLVVLVGGAPGLGTCTAPGPSHSGHDATESGSTHPLAGSTTATTTQRLFDRWVAPTGTIAFSPRSSSEVLTGISQTSEAPLPTTPNLYLNLCVFRC